MSCSFISRWYTAFFRGAVFTALFLLALVSAFMFSVEAQGSGGLRITEMMRGGAGHTWIEIVNESSSISSLSGVLAHVGGSRYPITASHGTPLSIPAGGVAVITDDADAFRKAYRDYSGLLYEADSLALPASGGASVSLRSGSTVLDQATYRYSGFFGRAGASLHVLPDDSIVPAPSTPGEIAVNPIDAGVSEWVGSSVSSAVFGGEETEDAVYLSLRDSIVLHVLDQSGLRSPRASLDIGGTDYPLVLTGNSVQKSGTYTVSDDTSSGEARYLVSGVTDRSGSSVTKTSVVKHNGKRVIVDIVPPTVSVSVNSRDQSVSVTVEDDDGMPRTLLYKLSDSACSGSASYAFVTGAERTLDLADGRGRIPVSGEEHNGKRICVKAVDLAGNASYAVSAALSGLSGDDRADGSAPVDTLDGSISLSEILYAPSAGASHEWIEVTNGTSSPVSLTDYRLLDGGRPRPITHVSGDAALAVGSSGIIAKNPDDFVADYPSYSGPLYKSSYSLNDAGDTIALQSISDDFVVASVTYTKQQGAYKNEKALHVGSDGAIFEGDPTPGVATSAAPSDPAGDPESSENVSVTLLGFDRGAPVVDGQNLFFTDGDSARVSFSLRDDSTRYTEANIDTYLTDVFSASISGAYRAERESVTGRSGGVVEVTYLVRFSSEGGSAVDNRVTIFPRLTDADGNVSTKQVVAVLVRDTVDPVLEVGTTARVLGFYDSADAIIPVTVSGVAFGDWLRVSYGGSCGDGLLSYIARDGGHGVYYDLRPGTYTDCTLRVVGSAGNTSAVISLPTIIVNDASS